MNKMLEKIAAILGIILIICGFLIYVALPSVPGGPLASLLGLILVCVYLFRNRKEIRESISPKSAKYGVNTAIFVISVFLITVLINGLADKYRAKFDFSINKNYTLSDQTKNVIKDLDNHIEIIGFIPKDNKPEKVRFKSFCDLYTYNSDNKITCRSLDPDTNPGIAKKFHVTTNEAATYGFQSGERLTTAQIAIEEEFTSAIIRLKNDVSKKLYFTLGHGEGDISSDDKTQFNKLTIKLENMGYKTEQLTPGFVTIPDDCAALVILGPVAPLLKSETNLIDAYLNRGGSVLLLVDPLRDLAINDFLRKWGLILNNDIVIDLISNVQNPYVPLVSKYVSAHPILKGYGNSTLSYTFFTFARSMVSIGKMLPDITVMPLITTSGGYDYSYSERDIEAFKASGKSKFDQKVDQPGPVAIGFLVTKDNIGSGRQAKLVVIGDSDFVNNTNIEFLGNSQLFLNTINWLVGDYELISIDRPSTKPNIISLSKVEKDLIQYISVLLLPILMLIAGFVIWWQKRKN